VTRLFIPAIHLPNGRDLFRPFPHRPAEFKKILKAYSERSLLECTPEDYIVLSSKPDGDYLEFLLRNGIGTEKIIECRGREANLALDILADETVLRELATVAPSAENTSFYIHLEEEMEIAKRLGLPPTMHPALTKMFNRYYFLMRLCEDLDVPLVESRQVRSGRFVEQSEKLLDRWKKVFVRGNESVGGSQVFIVENEAELRKVGETVSPNSRITRFFVFPFLELSESFNIQYAIHNGNADFFCASRQILKNGTHHEGNIVCGDSINPEARRIADTIAGRLAELGARGLIGIDLMVSGEQVYPAEINARRNTSTPAITLYKKLAQATGRENFCFATFRISADGGMSFAEFADRAGKENLFDLSSCTGVIPYHLSASRLTGSLDVAAFAHSPEEVSLLRKLFD